MRRTALALAVALLVSAAPRHARAAEGESALSGGAFYSYFQVGQGNKTRAAHGGVLGVDYEHGLSDSYWFRAAVSGGLFGEGGSLAWAGSATLGISYRFDVIKYVPFVTVGAGAFACGGGADLDTEVRPFVEIGGGLDVLRSRSFSWGIEARLRSYWTDVVYITVGPRFSYRWGYF